MNGTAVYVKYDVWYSIVNLDSLAVWAITTFNWHCPLPTAHWGRNLQKLGIGINMGYWLLYNAAWLQCKMAWPGTVEAGYMGVRLYNRIIQHSAYLLYVNIRCYWICTSTPVLLVHVVSPTWLQENTISLLSRYKQLCWLKYFKIKLFTFSHACDPL